MARLAHGLQRKRDLRLRDLSPALAGVSNTAAPMPGAASHVRGDPFAAASHAAAAAAADAANATATTASTAGNGGGGGGGGGDDVVTVVSVGERVTVLPTKTRPKRVTLLGSDGQSRAFLLKGHEDLRLDERAMQVLAAANTMLAADRGARRRQGRLHHSPRSQLSQLELFVLHASTLVIATQSSSPNVLL